MIRKLLFLIVLTFAVAGCNVNQDILLSNAAAAFLNGLAGRLAMELPLPPAFENDDMVTIPAE